MGILSRLFGGSDGEKPRSVNGMEAEYPSAEHTSTVELIEFMIRTLEESPKRDDLWITFSADAGYGKDNVVVQVQSWALNTCLEEVDVEAVCRKAGLRSLEGNIEVEGDCLYRVCLADATEMAKLVEAVFIHHFGLRQGYGLHAVIEG